MSAKIKDIFGQNTNVLEIVLPFLLAGFGMVLAGLLLDFVQHWDVFMDCSELFILVPALLGLKGNLEMTLASRLSTAANMGLLDDLDQAKIISKSNLALIQIQGVVVGGLAAIFALIVGWLPILKFDLANALLVFTSSVITASMASFCLGIIMIGVIIASRKSNVNPDNVATPIAASLGDLVTLAILAQSANLIYHLDDDATSYFKPKLSCPIIILGIYGFLVIPFCLKLANICTSTKDLLSKGWTPVLSAMVISSLGGTILNQSIKSFPKIASYQPVINGVAGNLVGVQASRLSTELYQGKTKNEQNIESLLLSIVVPGHLIFNGLLSMFNEDIENSSNYMFTSLYLAAALIQVGILLKLANYLVDWLWNNNIDPDSAAIPYLTSLGDFLGGALLALAVYTEYLLK